VKNAKAGQVQFRADKAGIIHATIGRRSFAADKLQGQPGSTGGGADQGQACVQQGVCI
jgi:large subunit ribosomal protein L1